MLFDLSIGKILVLAVLAVVIFGPDQLPRIAGQAGRALRELRRLAEGASQDLREGLGPEFDDFDIADLNPRNFVRKHLWRASTTPRRSRRSPAGMADAAVAALPQGESPPYDPEAT